MDDKYRIEKLTEVIYRFAKMAGIYDEKLCENMVIRLLTMDINDAIDSILVSLNDQLREGRLSADQIISNADLLIALNPTKYNTADDLINRLKWIRSMNLEHPEMPLSENHKLVLETFDKFNEIIGTRFDSFYTGGLMGYLATDHELERYHGDLDLFINEEQLIELYNLIEQSEDFEFVSNMDHKETNGHEFKIVYKDTPMSIGLFLFSRTPNREMVIKEYFYPEQNKENGLVVNENHLVGEFAELVFSEEPREHNNIMYKSQSLEGIYHAKKNSRPKDQYDAQVVEEYVDMEKIRQMDRVKQANYSEHNKPVSGSIVEQLDEIIRKQNEEQLTGHGRK